MNLSKRISTLTGDEGGDGWGVYYAAREMIAAGEDVLMLCIGEHDRKTAPFILDAMDQSARGGNTGYATVYGQDGLRAAIAERVEAMTGAPTGPENVIVTTGGQAALFAAMNAALDPGDLGLIVDPYYATYPGLVRAVGARVGKVRAGAETGFQIDLDDLAAQAQGARALLINTPHNPTGAVYTRETLAGVAEICRAENLWLISDEVYDVQVHEGAHLSPRVLPDMAARTMVIGSMSKSHVMTGFRLGWVVAPAEAVLALGQLANTTTYGVPGFIQDAAETAIREGDQEQGAVAALYKRRRDKALAVFDGGGPVRVSPPGGAMYVMLDIRATGMSGEAFAMAFLQREKVATMPGESFGQAAAGHLRVALTIDDDKMVVALERLRRFAEECA